MRSEYSFAALKEIDWDAVSGRYRRRAHRASTPREFVDAIEPMLAELRDLHVWVEMPDGARRYPYRSSYEPNSDLRVVRSRVVDSTDVKGVGWVGRTEEGIAVAVVTGLPDDANYREFLAAMEKHRSAAGFIVDLRTNGGGSERRAAEIAGFFTPRRIKYARNQVRAGGERALRETSARYLEPGRGKAYSNPVVCLIGPGCVSSGEGFALMMKALDNVTLVGQPSRGASGNPRPVFLSGGVKVWFSRWISLELDGTSIEGRGVQPDILVQHGEVGDETFERAVQILTGKDNG